MLSASKAILPALAFSLLCVSAQAAPAYLSALGAVSVSSAVVVPRIDGQLLSVNFKEGELVQKDQPLAKIDGTAYRLKFQEAQSRLARDQAQLDAAKQKAKPEPAELESLKAALQMDQAKVALAQQELSYAEVTAPVTGVAGFRLVDAGNFVHAGDRLVVLNQLQPIAVVFTIPQDVLPEVLAQFKSNKSVAVEIWDRQSTKKIAAGRLEAIDNQIDPATGTVKLKAGVENTNGLLFPNEIVVVRLAVNAQ